MPANRNALVRFKTIDHCLQNHYRKWTLDDLIEACSDALYEYEGITKGVSKRSIQADIQMMRSDKLGYNAPIIVVDKKYYAYEDRKYSITNIPITGMDLGKLAESVDFLKQFKGFSHFREIEGLIQKLEDHVYSKKHNQRPIIDFDRNEDVKGLEFLDLIYQSILQKSVLKIWYKTYRSQHAIEHVLYPLILKEFRNRWYVIARKQKSNGIFNFALDRIENIEKTEDRYEDHFDFDPGEYYKNVIGVTVEPTSPAEEIKLLFNHKTAPYVLTKPIHASQKTVKVTGDGVVLSVLVQHNFELEKEILSFGENVKVLSPLHLKRSISSRLVNAAENYANEISEKQLKTCSNLLIYKGFAPINFVYSKKEMNLIKHQIDKHKNKLGSGWNTSVDLFQAIKPLKEIVFNFNFGKILSNLTENFTILKSYIADGYIVDEEGNLPEETKTKILVRIPLDIDKNIPDYLINYPIKQSENAKKMNEMHAQNFYLSYGSLLLSKKESTITLQNFDPSRKNRIVVVEIEFQS